MFTFFFLLLLRKSLLFRFTFFCRKFSKSFFVITDYHDFIYAYYMITMRIIEKWTSRYSRKPWPLFKWSECFFVRFIFWVVSTISIHQLLAWRSTSKSHFSLGNTTIPRFCRVDHVAIHRDITRKTSILLNINFCIWKNMRLTLQRRTVKIQRWWVTKNKKNWIFKKYFSKNIFILLFFIFSKIF